MGATSLWGEEFTITPTPTVAKKIKEKVNKPKSVEVSSEKIVKSKIIPIEDKLEFIKSEVYRILGKYAENTICIRNRKQLTEYIDKAIENNIISIDTETDNSLDPLTCKLMGPCIYTPGQKNAYIPLHHTDLEGNLLPNQLTENDIKEEFDRLSNTFCIYHNGKFDYEVLKCTCDYIAHIDWDTMIAAQLLNENESAKLKYQYSTHIDKTQEKYDIEHLFEKLPYAVIDPDLFALYAATDPFITFKLYEYQKQIFELPENSRLYNLFRNIEMPIVEVAANMELTGMEIDLEYSKRLSEKYHKKADDVANKINIELQKYDDDIRKWRLTDEANFHPMKINKNGESKPTKSKNEQLADPIELTSPTQLSILLYDILKVKIVDKKQPRGTGEDILNKIDLPLCKLIVEQRGILKLLSTYIDALPAMVSNVDNRLHAHFNQLGEEEKNVRTGRFSSTNPNMQNIPSHENSIRMMFKAADGNIFIGSDFSAQEPRLLGAYSQDPKIIENYALDRDLYSTVACTVYKNKYEDNREFYPDGRMNPDGKKRRASCKSLILGLMYGRGITSIAEQIKDHDGKADKNDIKRAQEITDTFFNNYSKAKEWIENTKLFAHKYGYVEDLWGRRRRLPDIQLPSYEILIQNKSSDFNPILYCDNVTNDTVKKIQEKYLQKLKQCKSNDEKEIVKQEAIKNGVTIKDNGGFIATAERECVNARIQGGAATLTKLAMQALYKNERLKELGFKLVNAIHDELIGECPIENVEECSMLMKKLMIECGKPTCTIPMDCDVDSFYHWYEDVVKADINKQYKKLLNNSIDEISAFNQIRYEHTELTEEQIKKFLEI